MSRRCGPLTCLLAILPVVAASPDAQELLDRILARVGTHPITLTDVTLARGLGLVESVAGEEPEASAVRQLIERNLVVQEMMRLQVREPAGEAVEAEIARMRARVPGSFERLLSSTGYDVAAVRELARETLRIEAYLRQRFGPNVTPRDPEVRAWLADLRRRAEVEVVRSPR